jgi:hypothetical protein
MCSTEHCGVSSLTQKFRLKIAGVGTILELEPDISGGGGGASAGGTELRPRRNVPRQTLLRLMELLAAEESDEEPNDGALLGSGDHYDM